MSSQNYLDVLLKKKVTRIEHSSSLIKVAYRCAVIRCERARLLTNTVKIQRVVALFLKRLSVMRRNRAALKISRAWIKNCEEYFLRKKRSPMMVFQKYALKVAADKAMSNKVETIRRAKALMRSLIKTNKVHGSYLLFQ